MSATAVELILATRRAASGIAEIGRCMSVLIGDDPGIDLSPSTGQIRSELSGIAALLDGIERTNGR
jgi:hypothetical protein